jgi:steroid delta-isomerase
MHHLRRNMSQETVQQSPALTASQNSWRCVHAKDKEGWLALMADAVVIEDPIGPAYTNPDGRGVRGKEGASSFWDNSIGLTTIRITCEETFPSSSPDEIAHILQLRFSFDTARQARCAASSRTRSTTQAC